MSSTATDLTREHYMRQEVREIISKFAMPGEGLWRAQNGDFHRWYRYSKEGGLARLLNVPEDYDEIIGVHRTLYQTLNVFDPSLWMVARPKEEITSDNPLGTPADTVAYTLGTDIDKGHGCDIEDPETKKAVEAAAQYMVDYLRDHGIHESVWVLFSCGGIYVEIHHEICRPKSSTPEDRQAFFEELTDRYNTLIKHVEAEFFKVHPEYIGAVKYDALNNSKRVFKCILSIHKKKPYAVTPLNRDAIKINFERARVPLQEDMIAESRTWYSTFDPAEREPLLRLLDEFQPTEEERKRQAGTRFNDVSACCTKVDQADFPPCIRHIITAENSGEGKTRFTAILSAFLFQVGWSEDEAWSLVEVVSERNGLDNAAHIFDSCFGRLSCPSCITIQSDSAGYPHLGLKGRGVCNPDKKCDHWPGDYGVAFFMDEWCRAAQRERDEAAARQARNSGKHDVHEMSEELGTISEEEFRTAPRTFNPTLAVHLEQSNFVSKYMEYAKTTSDAYEDYHFASALVLLSVAVDRQIVVSMRHGDIFPNIWVFGIGDSTISRKTTAHKLCKLILKTKYMRKSLPSSFSPEALMEAIAENPRCYYAKDEAGSLLSSLCKDYMQETRDFMAEIYECDDYYRKLKKSECQITDPYITQYLMTTPDNLKEYTSPLDLTSGWLLRYMWFYPNHPKAWKPFAEKDASDFDRYTTIYGEYNLVASKMAESRILSLTPESMQFFQDWQRATEEHAMEEADNVTKALAGRLMTHAVKMAALFTIGRADFDENSKIELPHIREAARLVDSYFLPVGKIIVEEVARSETKNVQEKILGILKRHNGRISQRDLLRYLHMKISDVNDAVEGLIFSEEIKIVKVRGKKATVLHYVRVKSKTEVCHSVIVSHNEVYKCISDDLNKSDSNILLYTPHWDTMSLLQMGQDQKADGGEPEEARNASSISEPDVESGVLPSTTKSDSGSTCGIGPHLRKDEPTPANPDRIRAAAISEYGMNGWVDHAKVAHALELPLPEVVMWLQANYDAFERPGAGTGYRQRRAGEAEGKGRDPFKVDLFGIEDEVEALANSRLKKAMAEAGLS